MRSRSGVGRLALCILAAGVAAVIGLVVGCESGSGGTSGSTLRGNVVSFSGGSASYVPPAPRSQVSRIALAVMDLLVTPALAGDGPAITVTLQGTEFTSTTTDGEFEIEGIPAGSYTLLFTMGSETATYPIVIPDNVTIELEGITIAGGQVSIRKISIEADDDEDENGEDESNDDGDDEDDGVEVNDD